MSYILLKSISSSLKMFKNYVKSSSLSRTLTTSKMLTHNYEGDGKTTVTILNKELKHFIMIDSFNKYGFRLNNGIFVMGPLAVFPKTVLQWNVNSIHDLAKESLSLFCLLEPKIDILVIGTGDQKILPNKDVLQHLKSNKISIEILSTYQACSIFNFLNAEGRYCAAAFFPPESVDLYEEETRILETVEAIDDLRCNIHYDERRMK